MESLAAIFCGLPPSTKAGIDAFRESPSWNLWRPYFADYRAKNGGHEKPSRIQPPKPFTRYDGREIQPVDPHAPLRQALKYVANFVAHVDQNEHRANKKIAESLAESQPNEETALIVQKLKGLQSIDDAVEITDALIAPLFERMSDYKQVLSEEHGVDATVEFKTFPVHVAETAYDILWLKNKLTIDQESDKTPQESIGEYERTRDWQPTEEYETSGQADDELLAYADLLSSVLEPFAPEKAKQLFDAKLDSKIMISGELFADELETGVEEFHALTMRALGSDQPELVSDHLEVLKQKAEYIDTLVLARTQDNVADATEYLIARAENDEFPVGPLLRSVMGMQKSWDDRIEAYQTQYDAAERDREVMPRLELTGEAKHILREATGMWLAGNELARNIESIYSVRSKEEAFAVLPNSKKQAEVARELEPLNQAFDHLKRYISRGGGLDYTRSKVSNIPGFTRQDFLRVYDHLVPQPSAEDSSVKRVFDAAELKSEASKIRENFYYAKGMSNSITDLGKYITAAPTVQEGVRSFLARLNIEVPQVEYTEYPPKISAASVTQDFMKTTDELSKYLETYRSVIQPQTDEMANDTGEELLDVEDIDDLEHEPDLEIVAAVETVMFEVPGEDGISDEMEVIRLTGSDEIIDEHEAREKFAKLPGIGWVTKEDAHANGYAQTKSGDWIPSEELLHQIGEDFENRHRGRLGKRKALKNVSAETRVIIEKARESARS